MAPRTQWLDAGLATLAENGAPGATIDHLAARLGLSKGSYYHHFGNAHGFKTVLLDHFEALHTTRSIELLRQGTPPPAGTSVRTLLDAALAGRTADGDSDALEAAVRAWAHQDPEVRAVQERIDRARTTHLCDLCAELGCAPEDAERLGSLLYLVLVGAHHVVPPVTGDALRRIYELALSLAPSDGTDG